MKEGTAKELVEKYRKLTEKALVKASVRVAEGHDMRAVAEDFLEMARNYFSDAKHFELQGKPLTALAAYSYAHAWLDAGVRAGLLDGKCDSRLFTLPPGKD